MGLPARLHRRLRSGSSHLALQLAERCADLSPREPAVLEVLSLARLGVGDEVGADLASVLLLETAPQLPLAHRTRAVVMHMTRRPDLAAQAYRRALQLDPQDASLLLPLAEAEAAAGIRDVAVQLRLVAVQADTQNEQARGALLPSAAAVRIGLLVLRWWAATRQLVDSPPDRGQVELVVLALYAGYLLVTQLRRAVRRRRLPADRWLTLRSTRRNEDMVGLAVLGVGVAPAGVLDAVRPARPAPVPGRSALELGLGLLVTTAAWQGRSGASRQLPSGAVKAFVPLDVGGSWTTRAAGLLPCVPGRLPAHRRPRPWEPRRPRPMTRTPAAAPSRGQAGPVALRRRAPLRRPGSQLPVQPVQRLHQG